MPRVTSTFAAELVQKLQPMISKPTTLPVSYSLCPRAGADIKALREMIGCFCVAISHLTRDFEPITRILRACDCMFIPMFKLMIARLRQAKIQFAAGPLPDTTPTGLMLYITALIVEHVNLDQLAVDDDDVQRVIRSITEVRSLLKLD
jgi:hypothetical protein